jgi:glyoxylate carboligase
MRNCRTPPSETWVKEFPVPVIVEFMLEHATKIAMDRATDMEIDKITDSKIWPEALLTLQMRSPCSIEL